MLLKLLPLSYRVQMFLGIIAATAVQASASGPAEGDQSSRLVGVYSGVEVSTTAGTGPRGRVNSDSGKPYIVKQGDSLYRILSREYGLTGKQAEKLIHIICRENNIEDVRRLRIGQKITFATLNTGKVSKVNTTQQRNHMLSQSDRANTLPEPMHKLQLESPAARDLPPDDFAENVRLVWKSIVPAPSDYISPVSLNNGPVTMTIDPAQFPILPAMDGGRVLVDVSGKLSPSEKEFIYDTDRMMRIVPGPDHTTPRKFLAELIKASRFFSFQENFMMEFGNDPKLTIRSDFLVERSADSLANHDVVLMNAGSVAFPSKLTEFLKNEGFTLYEPFVLLGPHVVKPVNRLFQVTSLSPLAITDSLLKALSISPAENMSMKFNGANGNGLSITVMADRVFEFKGKRYCISYQKDPTSPQLLHTVLQSEGVTLIPIGRDDDFKKIAERILTSVGITGTYGFQSLWPDDDMGYSLQMSGIKLDNVDNTGESIFLTNHVIDSVIRQITADNGYVFSSL